MAFRVLGFAAVLHPPGIGCKSARPGNPVNLRQPRIASPGLRSGEAWMNRWVRRAVHNNGRSLGPAIGVVRSKTALIPREADQHTNSIQRSAPKRRIMADPFRPCPNDLLNVFGKN